MKVLIFALKKCVACSLRYRSTRSVLWG